MDATALTFTIQVIRRKRRNVILSPINKASPFSTRLIIKLYAMHAKSLQLCPTLCDPIGGSPPGYPVPGILQARTLEWVAISFSNAGK